VYHNEQPQTGRRKYWWIVAKVDGNPFLVFGGATEDEARQRGIEQVGSDFQLKQYPTRNLQAASAFFRGKRLEETHNLREASRRISHKIRRQV